VSLIDEDDATVLVAERGGDVIGYVYASLEGRSWRELRDACGFIDDVVVLEGERRGGVATALIDAALEWLRSRGAPRVVLWSAEPNVSAQRLFARLGFRRTMVEMTREL
jgi:GNAT superfamily N-acetyltransferase